MGSVCRADSYKLLLVMTSMNNGYDGSMMNGQSLLLSATVAKTDISGLQTVENWQEYFNRPTGSLLGVFNAIQSIGGIAGLPFAPYANDRFGRRWALFFGNVRKYNYSSSQERRLSTSHHHWSRHSDCCSECRHVYRLSIPHWFRTRIRLHGFARFDYRTCLPHSSSSHHWSLQHVSLLSPVNHQPI
jgi:hypothetical protein